jgi:hypothetical protein
MLLPQDAEIITNDALALNRGERRERGGQTKHKRLALVNFSEVLCGLRALCGYLWQLARRAEPFVRVGAKFAK